MKDVMLIAMTRVLLPSPLDNSTAARLKPTTIRFIGQGQSRVAVSLMLLVLFSLAAYLNLFIQQSIRGPSVWIYFILVPLTGFLLGRRLMVYGAFFCLCTVILLFYWEITGRAMPHLSAQATLLDMVSLGVAIALSTVFSQAAIARAEAEGAETEQDRHALRRRNRHLRQSRSQLQQVHDELERQANKRTQELEEDNHRLQAEMAELQRLVETLRTTEQLNQHTQTLDSLGRMTGGVVHDFNNLLTAMSGQAMLALARLDAQQQPIRNNLEKILIACRQGTEITRSVLNHAAHSPAAFVPINLAQVIQENLQLLSISIAGTIRLQENSTADLPPILGEPGQIQQLLMNLILNAADAIGEATGTVTVTTTTCLFSSPKGQGHDVADTVSQAHSILSPPQPGKYVCVEVADTGCGMDEATLQKIFDPFFTTKSTGRGLGLATVIDIVREHGGALSVASELGVGSSFQLLFPAQEAVDAAMPRRTAGGMATRD